MKPLLLVLSLAGCGSSLDQSADKLAETGDTHASDADTDTDADSDSDADTDADSDTDTDTDLPCPAGTRCNPFVISAFPYSDSQNTISRASEADFYSCAPSTDESGGDFWYKLTLAEPGLLRASVNDVPGDNVDIDVQLLSAPDPTACLARNNTVVAEQLQAGTYYLALDTWNGPAQAGAYTLSVSFSPGTVDCSYDAVDQRMFWSSCALPDCFSSGGEYYLSTPTSGPVVREAHLVTTGESFPNTWPSSFTDGITNHYTLSQAASGYSMSRNEPWAPAGEGGSRYGQGSTGAKIPVLDEAWYINMYWKDRPTGGTRMIVKNPANQRAVVVSAGWETGPGANTSVAGVTEEVHHWLGTTHLSTLEIGFAADQTLPLGPIACP